MDNSRSISEEVSLEEEEEKRKARVNNYKPSNVSNSPNTLMIEESLTEIIKPLFKKPLFYCTMLLSFELTLIREFFEVYIALFLHKEIGVSSGIASISSSGFSLMGIFSSVFCGFWMDCINRKKHWRLVLLPIFSIIMTIALSTMVILYDKLTFTFALVLICIIGFMLLGPYSLLAGVLSLELGGHTSAAMICGFVDGFGYVGALLFTLFSGFVGFKVLFFAATIIGILTIITSLVLFVYMKKEQNKIDKQYQPIGFE